MELGLHIAGLHLAGRPRRARPGPDPGRDARPRRPASRKLSVMDHVWQIGDLGPPEHEMLEAYTTLGFLAAQTSRVELLAWVTGVVYREPGLLAKAVTTLDVLSGGRAWLGIGAAWNEEESRGLGLPFPPTAERFERLEEALQICLQMWSDDDGPYDGQALPARAHAQLAAAAPAPAPADPDRRRRRAEDAAPGRAVRRGLQPLRRRRTSSTSSTCCASTARRSAATTTRSRRPSWRRSIPARTARTSTPCSSELRRLAALGVTHVHGRGSRRREITPLEIIGERVIPEAARF